MAEVLLLVACATIATCDDVDEIVAWGEHQLDFLCQFAPFRHGIPGSWWLGLLLNRIDPVVFRHGFESLVAAAARVHCHRRQNLPAQSRSMQGGQGHAYAQCLRHHWKDVLWSPSYFAASCGGAPISMIRQYIEQQRTPH